jgi:3',5'-cyclic AMP phosphodiesterase CpdA
MIRLAHVSDVHVTASPLGWELRDWFNKRLAAWLNLACLGRGRRFRHADLVMGCLARDWTERGVDHVVFSGDATALGFESELRRAAELLQIHKWSGLAVPGNHDYCTRPAAASGLFEQYFAPWQQGQRLDGAVYPFAQPAGDAWLVAVNSCTGNRLAWDAGGTCGPDQLQRLAHLLAQLPPGPRILVTHYPICLKSGKLEFNTRGLRDLNQVLDVARQGGVCLWLHGHRHGSYYFQKPPQAPFPVICAGSGTQADVWSYGEYELEGKSLRATRRAFDFSTKSFKEVERFQLELSQAVD